jgi:mannose-1-phosphate guanylyltransferase
MKAILLAAGFGKRLGKLTDQIPKPLVEVKGKPVIEYLIRKLIKLDVKHIYINTHYKHSLINDFIVKSKYEVPISLIYEKVMLGTAGTLKHLLNKVSQDNFIVMHADNYFEDDLENLKVKHIESGEDILVTMGTFKVSNPAEFGTVELSDKGTVIDFFEKSKNSTSNIANSAVYIIKPTAKEIIESLSSAENDISLNLIPKLLGKIKAEPLNGYFYDIGTPEILKLANDL